MSNKVEELKKDLAELELIEKQATRPKVKDMLSILSRKLISELVQCEEKDKTAIPKPTVVSKSSKRYVTQLNNYAWDQSDKFVKFYVTLAKAKEAENVECTFTSKSLELNVTNLENKDYVLRINNLLNDIDPSKSTWRSKTDMIIISVAKCSNENWSHVTGLEKKLSDSNKPDTSDVGKDPNDGLMSIMKSMYDKGDDEMKRTIAKAWTESQAKGGAMM